MKTRLSLLYFLQFSVWGCYLTCFGQLLGAGGIGAEIAWFYAAIGLVSILTPPLFGRLADRTGRPERLLGLCHLTASIIMFVMWRYAMSNQQLEFRIFYPLYLVFLSLYMPTMALANTATFSLLNRRGKNTVKTFPKIRIWGTVGFVGAMWFVNCAYIDGGTLGFAISDTGSHGHLRFQYTAMQLLCTAIMGAVTALYTLTLPRGEGALNMQPGTKKKENLIDSVKLMFGQREISVFLIFVIFAGVCLQISNGFVTPYITHFLGDPQYTGSPISGNATMLFSLSQVSEAACVLLVGITLSRYGIRYVYAAGLSAWGLRFLLLGIGNPGEGLWLLIASMVIYGVGFNFITIAGHLYIQQVAPPHSKGFAQGLMMFMSNGIGATTGTLIAGRIVNEYCHWEMTPIPGTTNTMRLFMGNWEQCWIIFGCYSFAIALLWIIFFRNQRKLRVSGS